MTRALYDRWAPLYPPVAHNALMRAEEDAVVPQLRCRADARALDAGAGTGRYTSRLHAAGAALVVSLDWSPAMLRHQTGGGARVCADARRLPFEPGTFDLVNASLMAGDIGDLRPWLGELARVLIPGGRIVYSDFHPAWHARGWQRTFLDEAGATVVLPCAQHTVGDHHDAWSAAGVRLVTMHEVDIPMASRNSQGASSSVPGLFVVTVVKPGSPGRPAQPGREGA
jgi:malonyl-CoA O-methyltransferase